MNAIHRRGGEARTGLGSLLCACCLFGATASLAAGADASAPDRPNGRLPDAFAAARHPDTVETNRLYVVPLQQLAGRDLAGGEVFYTVTAANNAWRREGRSPLRPAERMRVRIRK